MAEKATLMWKWEDGPEEADGDDPNDVGPAWIDRPDGISEKVNGGEWITRSEAERLAADHGYELVTDD